MVNLKLRIGKILGNIFVLQKCSQNAIFILFSPIKSFLLNISSGFLVIMFKEWSFWRHKMFKNKKTVKNAENPCQFDCQACIWHQTSQESVTITKILSRAILAMPRFFLKNPEKLTDLGKLTSRFKIFYQNYFTPSVIFKIFCIFFPKTYMIKVKLTWH